MSVHEVAAAARELASEYGCNGTREADLIERVLERLADKLDRGGLCTVCARPRTECRCGGDADRLHRLVAEMEWCQREHPDALVTITDVRAVRAYADRFGGY
ncbi:hypothetical protein I5G97_gp025 [Mycobacterium phage Curiosium]|uniref:Uncharacterized protein n=1 Tax=Mycobacterium phage Curiosium TaxID=2599859 RepID=A0A5J6TUU8_9CAUD|nr:hypothetical protein I5G97_gp025 [Mycobacterium phage Curiosium]QFG14128.1 hypothetical protein PBI_CURIOSIUM_85 [Mycobacterium phage Curiosium]